MIAIIIANFELLFFFWKMSKIYSISNYMKYFINKKYNNTLFIEKKTNFQKCKNENAKNLYNTMNKG